MDTKVQKLLEKAKVLADKTGKAAMRAADSAGKKASEMAQATKINLQIFDLNTECEILYKDLGRIMYDAHIGIEAPAEKTEELLHALDENRAKADELKASLHVEEKNEKTCPVCGKVCQAEDVYCSVCGAQI